MSTRTRTLTKPTAPEAAKTLDLSLPIPSDSMLKVEALDFLNEAVEEYIQRFGDDRAVSGGDPEAFDSVIRPDIHFPDRNQRRRASDEDDDFIPDAKPKRISVTQAIQLGLCAFLIFMLWPSA